MLKSLTSVGNSKALIIPAELIKKYNLDKVLLEETPEGILIRSASEKSDFQNAVEKLRKEKRSVYKRMEAQANDGDTIRYYAQAAAHFADTDTDILEE